MRQTTLVGEIERLPFEWIGNYRLIDKLGEGGMGEVYLGVEEPVGRKVAIKLMRAGLEKWGLQRFNDERKALASLNQRNIVVMLTSGEAYHRPYIVTEYLEGESLRERLRRGPMAPPEVVEITRQVCDALNAAHRREIVHRDIKPDNIFLTRDDDGQLVKVLDFGIATLKESETQTKTGFVIGTGPYLSPEQARGLSRQEIDGRADIYALGMVVYEMLTGVLVFTAQDLGGYRDLHLHVMPPRPSERMPGTGSEAIDEVVMKALAKDPVRRHQTAREFACELQAAVERGSVPEPRESSEHGRVQVLNALVEGRPGSKPSETVEESPVPAATPDARPTTAHVRSWRPLYILLLTASSLFLLGHEGWWIYTRFIHPNNSPVAIDGRWKGTWKKGETLYDGVASFESDSNNNIEGSIRWTLRKDPNPALLSKIGLSATEYIRGKYDPNNGQLSFEGYDEVDPYGITKLDIYRLSLSKDGSVIEGNTALYGGEMRLWKIR